MEAQTIFINKISYQGLYKARESFIKKISQIKINSTVDSLFIEKDVQNIKRLPSVKNANYLLEKDSSGFYQLTYIFEENYTFIPFVAIWTSLGQSTFRSGVTEYNFLGSNKSIGGYYQYNGFNSYSVNFKDPYLFSRKWGFEANFMSWQSFEPLYFDGNSANYKYKNVGLELLGSYQPHSNHQIKFGANKFNENYQYLEGSTSTDVSISVKKEKLLFKLNYLFNDLNYYYYLFSGFKSSFTFQYVSTQDKFLIGWNDLNYYKRVNEKGNFASRLRLGLSTNNETPFAAFALDNNINIRGVGNIIDRGSGTIVFNNEYRQTLFEKNWFVLQGNGFVDVGSWRKAGENLKDFIEEGNIMAYSGLGVRLIHKKIFSAILRIDYGVNIKDARKRGFVFGIGQYF